MRVITGTARGRKLLTLEGEEITRPTSQRVKEGMFSAVQFYLPGAGCLDIFAGSGQLGIEALSRGAKSCVFVDSSREAASIIRRNLASCGFEDKAKLLSSEALSYVKRTGERFDIAFVDPPYKSGLYERTLEALEEIMNEGGMVLVETAKDAELPEDFGRLKLKKRYGYSNTAVWLYRAEEE